MALQIPFKPAYGQGFSGTPNGTSQSHEIGYGYRTLCINNLGSVALYARVGYADVVATLADYCIPPNSQVTISKDQEHTHVACITAGTAGVGNVIPGEGF